MDCSGLCYPFVWLLPLGSYCSQTWRGLLATRVGAASHPGPPVAASSSAVAASDPWAAFLNERAAAASQHQSKSTLKAPNRSPWTSCSIDLSQLDFASLTEPLSMISPDAFTENATGVVMLTRPMFGSFSKISSKHALLVVLPGGLGLSSSACASHWMFLRDPLHCTWTRRLVTLVQMGAVPVLPQKLHACPAWDVGSHLEFSALLSRRWFSSNDAWASFLASSRTHVVASVRALHSSFDSSTVEFYSWINLDASTHTGSPFGRLLLRKTCCLRLRGQVSFIINLVCRDTAAREQRDCLFSALAW